MTEIHFQSRIIAWALLAGFLTTIHSVPAAETGECGPRLPEDHLFKNEGTGPEEPIGLLLSVRCGDRYDTSYLVIEGGEVRLRDLGQTVVSPQPDGFWVVDSVDLHVPEGCDAASCQHRGSYLFARRLEEDDGDRQRNALQRIRAEAIETLQIADREDASSEWTDELLVAAQGALCLRTTAHQPTGGPHPFYLDADGCVPLSDGRVQLSGESLGIVDFFPPAVVERTRERLRERYEAGQFRGDVPEDARSAIGPLRAEDARLLLDYSGGVMTAYAVADAPAPFVLSQTYAVEVMAEIGPAPDELAPFNPEPPEALVAAVPGARHLFAAPLEGFAVGLGEKALSVLMNGEPEISLEMPLRADDVIVAEWAVSEAALAWDRTLAVESE